MAAQPRVAVGKGERMIEASARTKRFGDKVAVKGLSFSLGPGTATGCLGPNGAGISTTMHMIIGLTRPTSGRVTVGGRDYSRHPAPLQEVGALIDAKGIHPGRSARDGACRPDPADGPRALVRSAG